MKNLLALKSSGRRFGGVLSLLVLASTGHAQDLVWKFDETGVPVIAKDSSGNGRDGYIAGNVAFTSGGKFGGAYSGFTSPKSQVYWKSGDEGEKQLGRTDLTLALWLKNPGNTDRAIVAGVGNPGVHNRAWEIWLGKPDAAGLRTLNLAWGHWNGGSQNYVAGEPVAFERDTWYFLAMTWKQVGKAFPRQFDIYLSKEGAASLGKPVFSGVAGRGVNVGPADTRIFYVGGNVAGWPGNEAESMFGQHFKEGSFGGNIDQVSLWLGRILDAGQLDAVFKGLPQ